jgi:glycosyltransferase involved in cell wall biosynthesis
MKILIACVPSSVTPDGITRHAINLAASLLHRPEIEEVHLAVGSWQLAFVRSLLDDLAPHCHLVAADCAASSNARNLWYLNALPRLATRLHIDLVHLAYPAPVRKSRFQCPIVTTLHDLYPIDIPHNFGYPRVLLNRFVLSRCLATVDAIACVSNSTLARLKTYAPQYAKKSLHIPNCVRTKEVLCPASDPRLTNRPFLLAVAQHRRNKNLQLTLEAFRLISRQHPDLLLVVVGNDGPETSSLQKFLADKLLRARVLLLHGISDQHLQWCYNHCKLLLATSSVEGFGLPIAEAMLTGCPVVCSDIPAFKELGESYCHFVPPNTTAALAFADAIQRVMTLPRPSPQPLLHLSAPFVADQYLRLYRTLRTDKPLRTAAIPLQARKDATL